MYFAGIDAHLNCLQVAVLDRSGRLRLNRRVSTREPGEFTRTASRSRHRRFCSDSAIDAQLWPIVLLSFQG